MVTEANDIPAEAATKRQWKVASIVNHRPDLPVPVEEMEFDVIALCCDFIEYDSLADYKQDYSDDVEDYIVATTENKGIIVFSH